MDFFIATQKTLTAHFLRFVVVVAFNGVFKTPLDVPPFRLSHSELPVNMVVDCLMYERSPGRRR